MSSSGLAVVDVEPRITEQQYPSGESGKHKRTWRCEPEVRRRSTVAAMENDQQAAVKAQPRQRPVADGCSSERRRTLQSRGRQVRRDHEHSRRPSLAPDVLPVIKELRSGRKPPLGLMADCAKGRSSRLNQHGAAAGRPRNGSAAAREDVLLDIVGTTSGSVLTGDGSAVRRSGLTAGQDHLHRPGRRYTSPSRGFDTLGELPKPNRALSCAATLELTRDCPPAP